MTTPPNTPSPSGGRSSMPGPHHDATLTRRSSAGQAAAYIRELIFAGDLAPGDRVPQDAIARALGISRIPVREAIVALEQEGRLRTEMHRGAFVVALDEQSVRDAAELVDLMQGFVNRRAAERATPDAKSRLAALQAEIDATSDPIEMRRHMERHRAIVMEIGTAPRIAQWIRGMNDLVPDNYFEVVPGALEKFRARSKRLTQAVVASDAAEAERAARGADSAEDVIRLYRERGLFGDEGTPAHPRRRR